MTDVLRRRPGGAGGQDGSRAGVCHRSL